MFFCVKSCCVSHFSWGSLICHCLFRSLSLCSLLKLDLFVPFFVFCFFYNALRIQKRQHVGILKQCAPPWLHESSFTFYLVFCVLFRSLFLALISFWGLLFGVSPCYVVVIHMSYCKDEIRKIFSFTMLFLCVS